MKEKITISKLDETNYLVELPQKLTRTYGLDSEYDISVETPISDPNAVIEEAIDQMEEWIASDVDPDDFDDVREVLEDSDNWRWGEEMKFLKGEELEAARMQYVRSILERVNR